MSITALFELWKRDHLAEGKAERTPRDHWHKIADFIRFVGHDDAKKVTPKEVSDWTENLRHERGLSSKTVSDKYLSALRSVFGVGVGKFRLERSPVVQVKVKVAKRKVERSKGYTDDEAAKVLSYALVAMDEPGRTAPLNRLAYRWLPWICAYTGARGGEIAQLRGEDFIEEAGIPCIRITPEAGSVKTGQFRVVPLHPHLIEQGVLDMVQSRGAGPLFFVPSKRKRSRRSNTCRERQRKGQ